MKRNWLIPALLPALLLAGCSATPTVRSTETTTPGPTDTTTQAVAAPTPDFWGEFPVPTLPASEIPWDQVGAGWFLLAYDANNIDEINAGPQQVGTIDDTLTLVSPEGELYNVRDLTGKGLGSLIGWGSQGLLVLDQNETGREPVFQHGRVDAIDLRSGEATALIADAHRTSRVAVLPDGQTVMWTRHSAGFDVDLRDENLTFETRLCDDGQHSGDMSDLSSDGERALCLLPRASDGKTDVLLVSVADGSTTPLDVFTKAEDQYWMAGWWDENSVIVRRVEYGPSEEQDTILSWLYDVSTRKIRDFDARMADGTRASSAFALGGYRVVSSGATVEVHSLSGELLASLPCEPEAVSGHMMLASCGASDGTVAIHLANLETGETSVVATYPQPTGDRNAVFPAPGGARRFFFYQ